jgi:hypothetical protein
MFFFASRRSRRRKRASGPSSSSSVLESSLGSSACGLASAISENIPAQKKMIICSSFPQLYGFQQESLA